MHSPDHIVELEGVGKRFGTLIALESVSFQVERGQIVSLLGPSGCGKSTTLRIIAGFETPDDGNVRLSGRDVVGLRPYERNVGLLFQDYALFPHMTVEQNVTYGMKRRSVPRDERAQRLTSVLDLVQLSGLEKRWPATLSGGQQQRVALARALATEPELILLDEPLSALDAKLRQELQVELKEILRSVTATAIVVTHDQEEAMCLAERVIVMDQGRIIQEGTPSEIYSRPSNRFVAEFIGRSTWFMGEFIEKVANELWRFRDRSGIDLVVRICGQESGNQHGICVRPERIKVLRGDVDPTKDMSTNAIRGRVIDAVYLGENVRILVEVGDGLRVTAIQSFHLTKPYEPGEQVYLNFLADDCIVLPK